MRMYTATPTAKSHQHTYAWRYVRLMNEWKKEWVNEDQMPPNITSSRDRTHDYSRLSDKTSSRLQKFCTSTLISQVDIISAPMHHDYNPMLKIMFNTLDQHCCYQTNHEWRGDARRPVQTFQTIITGSEFLWLCGQPHVSIRRSKIGHDRLHPELIFFWLSSLTLL